jgi:peptidoglycan hydrolase-like protein with peptidoglycan-binding domain
MRRNLWYSVVAFGLLTSPCLLAQGASRVRAEQQALKDKGFDPGPVDGRDGPKTRAALREFQAKQNLKQDGRLGPQTRDAC